MKRSTATCVLTFTLCVFLGFEFRSQSASKSGFELSSAKTVSQYGGGSAPQGRNPSVMAVSDAHATEEETKHFDISLTNLDNSDPDLPPFARGRIDEDIYLRLRERTRGAIEGSRT